MRKSWVMGGLAAAVAMVAGGAARPAVACEPIHDLLLFGDGGNQTFVECNQGQVLCDTNGQGNPINCIPCESLAVGSQLCWASECRGFNGDTGQYGQFKKDAPGELEAIVMTITNKTTNQTVTLVDQIQNAAPDCAAFIPQASNTVQCSALYKVKRIRPVGGKNPGPLCTFDNLDDVNAIARTPKSQNLIIQDVNGFDCKARKKVGDQWWMFFQTCCSPPDGFGSPGDVLETKTELVIDQGNGACQVNEVRPDSTEPEQFPTTTADSCL